MWIYWWLCQQPDQSGTDELWKPHSVSPVASATADNAIHAMQICDQVRHAIREQLKLPPNVTVGETQ